MTLLFIDVEASSLDPESYPIEIAWISQDGKSEAHLIKPQPNWGDWDETAERLHGISRERLLREGEPAREVAEKLLVVLHQPGVRVVSDSAAFDAAWLELLLGTVGEMRRLIVTHIIYLLADVCEPLYAHDESFSRQDALHLANQAITRTTAQATDLPRHRALPDAERLRWAWLEMQCLVAERLG